MTSLRKVCLILFLSSSSEAFTMTPVNSNNRSAITQFAITTGDNDSSESSVIDSRRTVLRKAAFAAASLVAFSPVLGANALDMEAFANAQIESDVKNCDPKNDPRCIPVLNADQALCKYGQGGSTARSEACRRVKAAGGKIDIPKPVQSLGGAYAM
ncbi:hypothetical protein FRACYDRAFT_267832 [Fragilariopsis cylindrus CCMP1102]|uniref:Uncharacterized protein n=1 Tax=Fragilariopsis cylindrus CCMP1102 TaxID=635003 RepID=A0A1E7FT50_9STRA|nr:hypothetical protein FRACYDRAFT_267832 [Fragilariopsis cylindrus CCMP1102]|eukprot:OEU21003.1 hypothetical protein FRACYDRAFT_267832 [Fragilariopsis cylindrus CCMP1102]